jgi:hypothetical protein
MAIAKIKSFLDTSLKTVSTPLERTTASLEPEVGLRIVHSPSDKNLRVTVLGARHLPQNFGFTRVNSYVVKVRHKRSPMFTADVHRRCSPPLFRNIHL